jgi:hypothetical protein
MGMDRNIYELIEARECLMQYRRELIMTLRENIAYVWDGSQEVAVRNLSTDEVQGLYNEANTVERVTAAMYRKVVKMQSAMNARDEAMPAEEDDDPPLPRKGAYVIKGHAPKVVDGYFVPANYKPGERPYKDPLPDRGLPV